MRLGKIHEYDRDCSLIEDAEVNENSKLLRLDLGCGNNKKPGFIGIDKSTKSSADWIVDLNCSVWAIIEARLADTDTWLPPPPDDSLIKDSSVLEIYSSHFIEHVEDLVNFMSEVHRVLVPGGLATFYAPYYSSIRAWQDPTHRREISENTFLYFSKKWMELNKLTHYNINVDFDTMSTKFLYGQEWRTKSDEAKEWARRHYFNVVDDIEIVMKAIK